MTSDPLPTPLGDLDAYVERGMRDWDIPGLAVVVAKDGAIVCQKGFGIRERGGSAPVDADTVFCIASLSKAFTAAALGCLVDDGRFGWDDPVVDYLPWFRLSDPYVTAATTIRDLLAHRVGVDDNYENGLDLSREELIHSLRHDGPITHFRCKWVYNNLHYLAAGQIIPAVTGVSWDDFVRNRIFEALGMRSSSTSAYDLTRAPNRASSHLRRLDGSLFVDPIDPDGEWTMDDHGPCGSVNATARDLTAWLLLHLRRGLHDDRRLLSESVIDEMHRPQMLIPRREDDFPPPTDFAAYGLGWAMDLYHGHPLIWHEGLFRGMTSVIAFMPTLDLGFVILANSREASRGGFHRGLGLWITDRYLDAPPRDWVAERLDYLRAEHQRVATWFDFLAAGRVPGTSPSLPLANYRGTFGDAAYAKWRVDTDEGDRLVLRRLRSTRPYTATLEHWHFDTFRPTWSETNADYWPANLVTFQLDAAGVARTLRFMRGPEPEEQAFDRVHDRERRGTEPC